jgi:predicted ArsR family transcriptional regulator
MTRNALDQDSQRLLSLLERGPHTLEQLSCILDLASARAVRLLEDLRRRGYIHTPCCVRNSRGRNVNLWELRSRKPSEPV